VILRWCCVASFRKCRGGMGRRVALGTSAAFNEALAVIWEASDEARTAAVAGLTERRQRIFELTTGLATTRIARSWYRPDAVRQEGGRVTKLRATIRQGVPATKVRRS